MTTPPTVDPIEQAQRIYKGIKAGGVYTNPDTLNAAIDTMFRYLDESNAGVGKLDPNGRETPDEIKSEIKAAATDKLFMAARHTEQEILGGTFFDKGTLGAAVQNMMADLKATGKTLGDLEPGQSSKQVETDILNGAASGLNRGARLKGEVAAYNDDSLQKIKAALENAGTKSDAGSFETAKIDAYVQKNLPQAKGNSGQMARLDPPSR